ncbi:protein FAM200C-like [Nothobranchius furzeri]|uniref:protein FAM200C-like n=1 Tax=Nothobranchius furzeri TaxID=105023 RepID=UPI0039049E2F
MSGKKRKWSDEYVKHGFTCITERDGSQRPICMICNAKLSNSSLAPAKLKEHFLKLRGDGEYKNTTLAEFKVKRARFDEKATLPALGFVPINKPILTASYEVAYLIAKQGKPHTIGETLVKPAALKMANLILGTAAEGKLSQIPLSNDTISDRIECMSKDILAQVVADLISSPAKFSLQLDETTDVSNLSQLAVFVRYVKDDMIKEEFLFCKPLTTTTKAADVNKLVDDFFRNNNLSWDMVSAVCTDGAPVMLGRKSGFGALACVGNKTLPPKMAEVLKIVVECVNYVRNSALRHRIFSKLCKEMGSEFEVLNHVFAMRVELAQFLQEHQHCHADCFKDSEFILILAYMADIFAALNHLNQQMQGGGVNIMEAEENLKAFQKKLPSWKRRAENNNFANFPLLDDCVSKIEDVCGLGDISVPMELKQTIAKHLDELVKSLDGYFPTRASYPAWVRQPFTFAIETADVNDEYLDEIIELQQSQVQQQLFRTTTLSTFWCQQMEKYPVIAKKALDFFVPFVTTYLCEQSFSRMLDIKTKKRNRLCCENDMRLALSKVKPRISELVSQRQQQKSH